MRIFTHLNVDLDAVCSVWAARRFIPGVRNSAVAFRPADWNGDGMVEGDLALDIMAGGRGLKGEQDPDGTVHSCFAAVMNKYAPAEDRQALAPVIRFVDIQDAYGSTVEYLFPGSAREDREVFARTGINAVLRSLQSSHHNNDQIVIDRMGEILDGMLKSGRSHERALKEADQVEILDGKVAICRNNREYRTNGILFEERGVRVIVYVDGKNLGLIRHNRLEIRMDHPALFAVVATAGEAGEWFAHPAGFLFCRGSRKAPAKSMSKVDPRVLAEAVLRLL